MEVATDILLCTSAYLVVALMGLPWAAILWVIPRSDKFSPVRSLLRKALLSSFGSILFLVGFVGSLSAWFFAWAIFFGQDNYDYSGGDEMILPVVLLAPMVILSLVCWLLGLTAIIRLLRRRTTLRRSLPAILSYLLEVGASALLCICVYWLATV